MSGRSIGLRLYAAATAMLSPLAGPLLRARARAGKEDPDRVAERLGRPSFRRPDGRLVWLHGASVGESLSLIPLAQRLRDERPGVSILMTSGTRAAADILAARLPNGAMHQYAPVDTPGAARRFIGHWRPHLVVFAESELWPNLIAAARARGARLALVSARLSPASARRWRTAPAMVRAVMGAFDLVLARDAAAAEDLRALGARVDGVGDAKLAAPPLPFDRDEAERLRTALVGRLVVVAASTHPGEEALILASLERVAPVLPRRPLLVVAPRHTARGEAVERLARGRNFATARRRSEALDGADLGRQDVYVADTVGELGLWFRLAGVALMGGSLVEGIGGHNPLEPARLGCPILVGRHTENWPIYAELEAAGGCARLSDATALDAWLGALSESRGDLLSMASRAEDFAGRRDIEGVETLNRVLALLDP